MATSPQKSTILKLTDTSRHRVPADFLLGDQSTWGQESTIGRLAKQLIDQNEGLLRNFGVSGEVTYYGDEVSLLFETRTIAGALPLVSPTTGRVDYGLVIQPRFGWTGLGRTLARTGWRVVPELVRLPKLPQSDRKVPPWVLSSTVLRRIEQLIDNLSRQFALVEEDRKRPRGQVQWARYAQRRIAHGRPLDVPCRFPELREDRALKAAIRHTLQKQRRSLETQRTAGPMVIELLSRCRRLLSQVEDVAPTPPTQTQVDRWMKQPFQPDVFRKGLEAISWTVEERGLAGLGDLEGLPWRMQMEEFFEGWVETVADRFCRLYGGTLHAGRKGETVIPLSWDPPYLGSQASLRPDVIIKQPDHTIILDAKYKSHWEELNLDRWYNVRDALRDRHRKDLLQVLAYANLADTNRVTVCLVYPCQRATWNSLSDRNRLAHRAELGAGEQSVFVVLTAIPIEATPDEAVKALSVGALRE